MRKSASENSLVKLCAAALTKPTTAITKSIKNAKMKTRVKRSASGTNFIELSSDMNELLLSKDGKKIDDEVKNINGLKKSTSENSLVDLSSLRSS